MILKLVPTWTSVGWFYFSSANWGKWKMTINIYMHIICTSIILHTVYWLWGVGWGAAIFNYRLTPFKGICAIKQIYEVHSMLSPGLSLYHINVRDAFFPCSCCALSLKLWHWYAHFFICSCSYLFHPQSTFFWAIYPLYSRSLPRFLHPVCYWSWVTMATSFGH